MRQDFDEYNSNNSAGSHVDTHHQHEPFHSESISKNVNSSDSQYNQYAHANDASEFTAQTPPYNAFQPNNFQAPPNNFQAPPNNFQAPPNNFQAPPNNFQAPPNNFQAPPNNFQVPPAPPQQSYPNNSNNKKENKDNNTEVFIIVALLSSVIITSLIIGFGWTLFSPKQKTPNISHSALAPSQQIDNEIFDTTEITNIENQGEGEDLVIMYGTESTSETPPPTPADTAQATPPLPTPTPTPTPTSTTPAPTPALAYTPPAPTPVAQIAAIAPPSSPPPASLKTLYWIQVFSTTNRDKAHQVQQDILTYGLNAQIVTKTVNDELYYRLRIGPFHNQDEGKKFLSWVISNNDYNDAFLVVASTN